LYFRLRFFASEVLLSSAVGVGTIQILAVIVMNHSMSETYNIMAHFPPRCGECHVMYLSNTRSYWWHFGNINAYIISVTFWTTQWHTLLVICTDMFSMDMHKFDECEIHIQLDIILIFHRVLESMELELWINPLCPLSHPHLLLQTTWTNNNVYVLNICIYCKNEQKKKSLRSWPLQSDGHISAN